MNNPNSKLFVGNLSFQTTRDELMHYFSGAGTVQDAVILTNKYTGRSRGFGFVQMSTPEEAIKAKEMFHGKDFMGRVLVVNDATPERPKDLYQAPQASTNPSEPVVEPQAPVAPEPVVEAPIQPEPVSEIPTAPVETTISSEPVVETPVEPTVEDTAKTTL